MTKKNTIFKSKAGRKGAEREFRSAVRSAERVGAPAIPKHTRAAVAKMKTGELRAEAAALRRSTRAIERTMVQNAGNMGAHDAYAEIIKLMPTEKGKDRLRELDSDDVFQIAKELVDIAPERRKGLIGEARRRAARARKKATEKAFAEMERSGEKERIFALFEAGELPDDPYDGLDF